MGRPCPWGPTVHESAVSTGLRGLLSSGAEAHTQWEVGKGPHTSLLHGLCPSGSWPEALAGPSQRSVGVNLQHRWRRESTSHPFPKYQAEFQPALCQATVHPSNTPDVATFAGKERATRSLALAAIESSPLSAHSHRAGPQHFWGPYTIQALSGASHFGQRQYS